MKILILSIQLLFISVLSYSQTLRFQEIKQTVTNISRIDSAMSFSLSQNFRDYKIVSLNLQDPSITRNSKTISLSIPGISEKTFQGYHNENISDQTDVILKSSSGVQGKQNIQMTHFNGLSADKRDHSSISIGKNFLMGSFTNGDQKYFIEHLKNFIQGSGDDLFIIYKASDVITKNVTCGTTIENITKVNDPIQQNLSNDISRTASTTPRTVELALAADYSMYQNHGQSVNDVAMYLSGVINLVQGLFMGNFTNDLTFQITEIVVFTSPQLNPWPPTENIFTNLENFYGWSSTGFSKPFDLSQYWIYAYGGNVAGVAYKPNTCNNKGNSVIRQSPMSVTVGLTGHEIGHNFNADHDAPGSPYIMADTNYPRWSSASISAINNYLLTSEANCITTPGVLISYNTPNQVCPGSSVKFSATVADASGANPHYQWKVNGVNIGSDSPEYTTTTLSDGDFISCLYTSTISGNLVLLVSNNLLSPVISSPIIIRSPRYGLICEGGSTTLISNAVSNNQWFKDGLAISGATGTSLVVSTSGSYSVKIILSGCQSVSVAEDVEIFSTLTPTLSTNSQIMCDGDMALFQVTPIAFLYDIYKDGLLLYRIYNPYFYLNEAGTYTVKTGCSPNFSNAIVLTVNPVPDTPTVSSGGVNTFCAGGSVTLTSNAASGNQWYNNGTLMSGSTNTTLIANATGSYSVKSTVNGCTSNASNVIAVTVNPIPTAPTITSGASNTLCTGGSVTLTSNAVNGNQWYNNGNVISGSTNTTLIANASGSYSVKSTVNGCTSNFSNAVVVTINPIPTTPTISSGGVNTFCAGGSVTLTSNAASGNQWYNNGTLISGSTNTTLIANATGSYSVKSTVNGCTSNASNVIAVTVNPIPTAPTITSGGSNTLCTGGSVTLTSNAANGNQWYNNGTLISGSTNTTLVANASGSYSVKSTVNGCTSNFSNAIAVTVNSIPTTPTVSSGGVNAFCAGGSVTLTSNAATGNQWYNNGSVISGSTNTTLIANTSGSYSVKSTVNGCTSNFSNAVAITVNPIPTTPTVSSGGVNTFCAGGSVTLTSIAANGNQWYNNGTLISGSTNTTLIANASGNYSVKSTVNGCTSNASNAVAITVNPIPITPTISSGGVNTFCAGGSVTLTSNAVNGNQWYNNGNVISGSTNTSLIANATGSYSVKSTVNGCTSNASNAIAITVNPIPIAPIVSSAGVNTFCTGGSVTLTSNAANGNQWYNSGIAISGSTNTTLVANASGSYSVKSTVNSCASNFSNSIVVTVNPIPVTPIISKINETLVSSVENGNQWFFNSASIAGETNQTFEPKESGQYAVQLTEKECVSSMSDQFDIIITAVNEPASSSKNVLVYPNPVKEFLIVENKMNEISIHLFDMMGREVINETILRGIYELNVKFLVQGSFVLIVKDKWSHQIHRQLILKN